VREVDVYKRSDQMFVVAGERGLGEKVYHRGRYSRIYLLRESFFNRFILFGIYPTSLYSALNISTCHRSSSPRNCGVCQ
jgi:hypothetical protein